MGTGGGTFQMTVVARSCRGTGEGNLEKGDRLSGLSHLFFNMVGYQGEGTERPMRGNLSTCHSASDIPKC